MNRLIPVLELGLDNVHKDTIFVPATKLDSMVSELSSDYDFGLGQMDVRGAHELNHELGKLNKRVVKKLPIKAKVKFGNYKPLTPAKKPTTKAPVHAAVKKVVAAGKKPVVLARPKASAAGTHPAQPTLAKVYDKLEKTGKVLDLMNTKRQLQSEHKRLLADDKFQGNVIGLLKKINTQVTGSGNKNYYQKWLRLKKATGVAVQHR